MELLGNINGEEQVSSDAARRLDRAVVDRGHATVPRSYKKRVTVLIYTSVYIYTVYFISKYFVLFASF